MTMNSTLTLADFQEQAADLIEARRALHGDLRMEDTTGGTGDGDDGAKPDDAGDKPTEDEHANETPDEKIARLESEKAEAIANSRKHEGRAKSNKDKAKLWDDAQAANATPDQKLTAAEQRAADAETELARYRVAHETSLPASLLSMLTGDEDQMREQAKALLEFKGTTPPKKPLPDHTQGGKAGAKTSHLEQGRADAQRRHGKPAA